MKKNIEKMKQQDKNLISQFSCTNCGKCCTNIDNLALFEWEKDKLLSLNPNIKISPGHKIKYKGTDIILYWGLNSVKTEFSKYSCPFLQIQKLDSGYLSKCTIYPDRPMVCRSFPLFHSGLNSQDEVISLNCPISVIPFHKNEKITKKEFLSRLKAAYGEIFYDAVVLDLTRTWVKELAEYVISYLDENNIGISENEIGLFELAINQGIITKKEMEEEIQNIKKMARETIENL
jgi:Fe-S-cluster containining protein